MSRLKILPRKAKETCSVGGYYLNHYNGVNFRQRVKPSKECLPGHFIVDRIIASKGTAKVSPRSKIIVLYIYKKQQIWLETEGSI